MWILCILSQILVDCGCYGNIWDCMGIFGRFWCYMVMVVYINLCVYNVCLDMYKIGFLRGCGGVC